MKLHVFLYRILTVDIILVDKIHRRRFKLSKFSHDLKHALKYQNISTTILNKSLSMFKSLQYPNTTTTLRLSM